MTVQQHDESRPPARRVDNGQSSQLIDWFAEGQTFAVEVAGIAVTVRFVSRNGRRARIAITGPAGAVFRTVDSSEVPHSGTRPALSSTPPSKGD